MPDPQTVDYDALARQAGGSAIDDAAAEFGGVAVADAPAPRPAAPAADTRTVAQRLAQPLASMPGMGQRAADLVGTYGDLQMGALKGAGNTVLSVARLGYKLPGLKTLAARVSGQTPEQIDAQIDAGLELMKASNTAQAIGRTGEQIAETLLPGRYVSKAAEAGAVLLPKGLQTVGRMAVEGAGGAGLAAAQGSDPRTAGVVSAAIPAAGALVRGGRRVIGGKVAPAMVDTAEMAERRGIPVDAATLTGSRVTQAVQNLAGRGTFGGQMVRDAHETARVDAMRRVAGDLATEAHPDAMTPELAGQVSRDGVKARVRQFYDEANNAYADLRDIAARPENVRLVPKQAAKDAAEVVAGEAAKEGAEEALDTAMFRPTTGRKADLWADVLSDAKKNGYRGSPTALRQVFEERMGQAQSLVDEMGSTNYGRRFLRFIAEHGGIGRKEATDHLGNRGDLQGEIDRLWEMSTAARRMTGGAFKKRGGAKKQQFNASGAIGDVAGVVRQGGKSAGEMLELLRSSDEFGQMGLDQLGDAELVTMIEEAAELSSSMKFGPLEALAQTGVRPGQQWWNPVHEAVAGAADDVAEQFDEMALPVDMRPLRDGLRPLYDQMTRQMPVFQQQASPGLKALENVINGPDYLPALTADADLGAIKKLARGAEMPELRNTAQGVAAETVRQFEDAVQAAIAQAGPEATAARNAGREATKAKAGAADVLKRLRKEPVQTFEQLTMAKDAGIDMLREVQRLAPREMPKLGRAYLEKLFAKAAARDGWSRENSLLTAWENLGPETKKLLYPNAGLRRDLDAFFKLAVKAAENTNPSGSGWTLLLGGQAGAGVLDPLSFIATQIGGAAVAKLLYTPRGVKLLTQGLHLPTMSPASAANVLEQLRRASERAAVTTPAAVPAGPPSSQPAGAR